jgi:hypothetical protein
MLLFFVLIAAPTLCLGYLTVYAFSLAAERSNHHDNLSVKLPGIVPTGSTSPP